MTDVEDHHVLSLDAIVNAIRITSGWQDTDLAMGAYDTYERIGEQPMDTVAQVLANTVACGRRAAHGDVM
jgi:hypothetical protein